MLGNPAPNVFDEPTSDWQVQAVDLQKADVRLNGDIVVT
jgi:hypothetical protein